LVHSRAAFDTPHSALPAAQTKRLLHELAALEPKTLAAMHGSTVVGDGARALRDLAVVMRDVYSVYGEEAGP
jgi:hypothetical protein